MAATEELKQLYLDLLENYPNGLSNTSIAKFNPWRERIAQWANLDDHDVYVVSAGTRPGNLPIRLTQGRATTNKKRLGVGVINAFEHSDGLAKARAALRASWEYRTQGRAFYSAIAIIVVVDDTPDFYTMVEEESSTVGQSLQRHFPNIEITRVDDIPSPQDSGGFFEEPEGWQDGDEEVGLYTLPPHSSSSPLTLPLQTILHGCPGSGKSFELAKQSATASKTISIAFNPDTTYSDFVGVYRPFPIFKRSEDVFYTSAGEAFTDGEPYITYQFVPGPFVEAYCYAVLNPGHQIVLIIDELSRANASLVFGDMLQLLDRNSSSAEIGYSTYKILPKPEIQDYLIRHSASTDGFMRLPPNFYIWATMNRSDQNARQIDAAFLRRWVKRHMTFSAPSAYGSTLVDLPGGAKIEWDVLRGRINERLINFAQEDKFIGPYFLSSATLSDKSQVAEDLLGYLWNDVLRARAREFFAYATLSEVLNSWTKGANNPFRDVSLEP